MVLTYADGDKIVFDRRMTTNDGWIAGVEILPMVAEHANVATAKTEQKLKRKDVNELHAELGHPSEDVTRATGAARGMKVVGTFAPCENCALSKAKQTKVSKIPAERSQTRGKRLLSI